jgi:hypothetical protein
MLPILVKFVRYGDQTANKSCGTLSKGRADREKIELQTQENNGRSFDLKNFEEEISVSLNIINSLSIFYQICALT